MYQVLSLIIALAVSLKKMSQEVDMVLKEHLEYRSKRQLEATLDEDKPTSMR